SFTSSWTRARPMPEPSWVRPWEPATRWKRSNSFGNSWAGMPVPVSRTEDEMLVRLTQPHLDFAVESELEGVGEEIEDDLLPHLAIDAGRLGKRRAIHNEPQARLLDR